MRFEILVESEKEEPDFEELESTKEKAFELAKKISGMIVYGFGFTKGTLIVVEKD